MRHAPLVIALLAASTARADSDRTLHLAVHGSIDIAVLGESLAKELGVDVAAAGDTCDVPCLDITVDGKRSATVLYAPRSGSPRARTIKLGANATQWPIVITLLAGNVVRDELQDVLAGIPRGGLPRPAVPEDVPSDPYGDEPPATAAPSEPPEGPAAIEPPAEPPPTELPPSEPPVMMPPPGLLLAPPPMAIRGPLVDSAATEHSFIAVGLVPVLSTDLTRVGRVRHFISVHALVGVSGGSSGLSLSGVVGIERGLVAGLQLGGVVAAARRVAGIQVAGVAAVAGEVDGVQIAGTAAVADRVDGIQAGGVAAFSRGHAGTQAAGVVSFAGGDSSVQLSGVASVSRESAGLQVAGVANDAGGDANVQIGGVSSVARGTANIQIAGVINYARRVVGLQIGTINVARQVDGVQIGVVNVGGSADGFSFGLINIVPGGRYDVETAIDTSRIGTVLFRHGGRRWHNVYGVAGHPVDETGLSNDNDDVWAYGLGFGPSLAFGDTVIDLEAIGWQVNHGARHESDISILGQLRLSVAHHWGPFAIVAGGILNGYVTNDQASPLVVERRRAGAPMETGVTVTTWPSAFVGLRI
jgi:hypothetical protein